MKPKIITTALVIVIITIIAVTGWVAGITLFSTKQSNQNLNDDLVKVKNNEFSFLYPKSVLLQEIPSTEGNYANYQMTNPVILPGERSEITVSVPLKNTSNAFTLADEIKNEADPSKIIKTSLNGHQCESITYRLDTNYPGDRPVHAFKSRMHCVTRYETSPLSFDYIKYDTDASLDNYWDTIRQSIKY